MMLNIQKILKNEWVIGLLLLGIFLATNGYTYGWDDQHVEIPLLKKLIDPTLYPNDYYIDALKSNFMSFLYPILAKVITVDQIPNTFFLLYLLSRYFLFFFMYKIWLTISKNNGLAVLSVLMVILLGRVEEFLYRTFSHQEFALAIIFAGIYFFYKERFIIAAAILGLAANFHALYSLFPMCYLGFYLLTKRQWGKLGKSGISFIVLAMPFLIWAGRKYLAADPGPTPSQSEWIGLYQLACPQNFLFLNSSLNHVVENMQAFWDGTGLYWFMAFVGVFHVLFTKSFRSDQKTHAILTCGWIFLACSFIFSYIIPSRFILDLNLIRNSQYMLFFLMGYFVIFLWGLRNTNIWKFFACLLVLPLMRFGFYPAILSVIMMALIQWLSSNKPKSYKTWIRTIILNVLIVGVLYLTIRIFLTHRYSRITLITFTASEVLILFSALICVINTKFRKVVSVIAFMIPFMLLTFNFIIYHKQHHDIEKNGLGFWQLQRNWIDMQNYVRKNTPKDALFLVPHDMEMGGFRIRSERSVIMSYRDCGVVGFDYAAADEWKRRLSDIGAFQVIIKNPTDKALLLALSKYRVNYIVFMSYYNFPENQLFKKIYENETFKLYKVMRNP